MQRAVQAGGPPAVAAVVAAATRVVEAVAVEEAAVP